MSLGEDITDFNTTTSVYYVHLQYSLICYMIVLLVAFFVLPLPRAFGVDGVARLMIGGLLYIGFAVLLVYAPKLLHSTFIGRWFAGDTYEAEARKQFAQMSETDQDQIKLEEPLFTQNGTTLKILAQKDQLTLNKKQTIAACLFFQCLLIELFCLGVLINSDHSLLVSNPVTQNIADALLPYTQQTEEQVRKHAGFFYAVHKKNSGSIPFAQFNYMAESIFFIHIIATVLFVIKLFSMFVFSRPLFVRDDVFSFLKKGRYVWAVLGTLITFAVSDIVVEHVLKDLSDQIARIEFGVGWLKMSMGHAVMMILVLIFFRFMEDWYKLIFRKF